MFFRGIEDKLTGRIKGVMIIASTFSEELFLGTLTEAVADAAEGKCGFAFHIVQRGELVGTFGVEVNEQKGSKE